jgi:lysozyme
MVKHARMGEQLILHEGIRLAPYLCTRGYWTIGVGFNFQTRGLAALEKAIGRKLSPRMQDLRITREEALLALDADIDHYESEVVRLFPAYLKLNEVRQRVCLDMAFNMGYAAFGFKNTMKFIAAGDWSQAVQNMWKSKWAGQVGDGPGKRWDRADRLTKMLLTGVDYVV